MQSASWLLIALPLASAAVLFLIGKRGDKWGHYLGVLVPVVCFVYAVALYFGLRGDDATARSHSVHLWNWIPVGGFQVDVGLQLDQLSMCFVLLITGVGSLIHIYSLGYMAHDPKRRRFFAYFNLFIAAMLLLVLGNSFLSLYVGWEGVGLASYLLIGFWTYKPAAATAAKKAFLMNRVGDVGLSLAIMLMFAELGTTSFDGVFGTIGQASPGVITAIALLLLLGACGKSGQMPLQAWLPDAMEGPTPVSALIHAATMVTAGVYLIARSNPIFDLTHDGRTVVAIVGAATLLYGCICGCAYDDIKKVLAYSTVSQIGYMFLAVGLGPVAYAFGIAHLLAHGFFKAGLFLGAGSVMHGMNDEVDMRKFGGLARVMPITTITFGIGYLALIGFPFLSGFYTKDKIIEAAYDVGGTSGWILGTCALLGALLTAFYMTRLMAMTFFGKRRWDEGVHPHESPAVMTAPMIVLAIGSLGAGAYFTIGQRLVHWLEPVTGFKEPADHTIASGVLTTLTIVAMVLGVALAWLAVARRPVPATPPPASAIVVAARRNLYGDALNEALIARPGEWLSRALVFLDSRGVDGIVGGIGAGLGGGSARLRRLQTGFVRSYALSMLGGSVLVVGALLAVRFG
ncbi:MAG TPA: NADH-quinone oxidoreductase subunit L [Mycobacteriales bacterium]|nr:NADH-quinone oxidoreductase subunit L [Mycobacteriales bacterium]